MGRRRPRAQKSEPAPAGEDREGRGFDLLARPWLLAAATALWVARPLFPSESAATQGDGLPAVMLWIALAVIWLLGILGKPRFRLRFGWVDLAVLLLVAWHTIVALWAASHLSPRPAVNMLWEWVGLAVSFFLARQLLAGRSEARAAVAVMGSLAVALAAYALYQVAYDLPATRAEYRADPDAALAEAGLGYAPGSPERAMYEKRLASLEPIATFALTNSLAGYLAPWLVVVAGVTMLGRADRRSWRWLLGPGVCTLVIAASLVLTKSRSAYLAVMFGLVLIAIAWRRKAARIPWRAVAAACVVAAVLAAAAVASGGLDKEVLSEATKSLGYRGQYWQSTLAMIADHPVLGCGPGNFQDAYLAYKLPAASEEIADPHNFLFEVWATAGTPAMLALLALLLGFFIKSRRSVAAETAALQTPDAKTPEGRAAGDAPPDPPTEHPGFVYAGAILAFAAVNVLAAMSVAPPGLWTFLVMVPCACAAMGLLWSWVRGGSLPPGLPAIGVAVLLVNLSAAGGIGYPGVSGSLWLLMAIGLNTGDSGEDRTLPGWAGWGLLVGGIVLAYACYATAYGPVLRCHAAVQLSQTHPLQAEQYLAQAAMADPLASDPPNSLAALAFQAWKANPSPEAARRVEQFTELAISRAPRSAAAYRSAGHSYWEMYQRTKDPRWLQEALAAYRRTVELYPNSAVSRAQFAIALRESGSLREFQTEREKALWLDETTPHLDKKLPSELRKSLQRSNSQRK